MVIYPAIDLKDGQCVRLVQGQVDNKTVYSNEPEDVAKSFQQKGASFLHVVDLDGAFKGSPQNLAVIRNIAAAISIPFQIGGGLREIGDIETLLEIGANRVIIGTSAVTSRDFVKDVLKRFGADRIVLGIDAREGFVAVKGWVSTSSITALEFGREMKSLGIRTAVFTDISRDGLLQGPNILSTREIASKTGLEIIASGGVSTLQNICELKALEELGVKGAIIGKALYDGKLSLTEAIAAAS